MNWCISYCIVKHFLDLLAEYFCFIDCAKASDYVDHSKLRKILKEM